MVRRGWEIINDNIKGIRYISQQWADKAIRRLQNMGYFDDIVGAKYDGCKFVWCMVPVALDFCLQLIRVFCHKQTHVWSDHMKHPSSI